ncbi:unnamed protein product [Acanthosepion pharaonis]|uniref:Uncharacterized protein n=1 Tax=Acanthosepion pharaonis TaxID=158019 RepID=A0A812D0U2_ACAPH|nr:unnamed protein product [Sepia pharaonis]
MPLASPLFNGLHLICFRLLFQFHWLCNPLQESKWIVAVTFCHLSILLRSSPVRNLSRKRRTHVRRICRSLFSSTCSSLCFSSFLKYISQNHSSSSSLTYSFCSLFAPHVFLYDYIYLPIYFFFLDNLFFSSLFLASFVMLLFPSLILHFSAFD